MKSRWITAVVLAAMWGFAAVLYPRLPARIPTHWDLHGSPNGWGGPASAFLFPAVATGLAALFAVLPRIDPRRAHWRAFSEEVGVIANVLVLFIGWIEVAALGASIGWHIDFRRSMLAGVGVLLAVIGNYLPRIRSNWWIGIRTPWTLESERVWRDTHRVAGRTFVAGGVVAAAGALLPELLGTAVMVVALLVTSIVPVVYSYLAWRRETAGRAG